MRKKKDTIPALAAWILARMIRDEDRLSILSDFSETYEELTNEKGYLEACRWYWSQVLKSIPLFLINNLYWRLAMIKNYLKIAWRILIRSKTFSLLNITGFAVGIATYLMIGLYVQFELSYDRFHVNADRIYQITVDNQAKTPDVLAPTLLDVFPEIEAATRLINRGETLVSIEGRTFIENNWVWADEHILEVFTFPLLKGNKKTAMRNPDSIIISEDMAFKYFGNNDPINKVLYCSFFGYVGTDFIVKGVLKNIPKNSHVRGDFFANLKTLNELRPSQEDWNSKNINTFILLREKTDPHVFEEKYKALLESKYNVRNAEQFSNQSLTDLHLRSTDIANHFAQVNDIRTIYLFAAIALVILFMACINYLNLSTARSIQRSREVGIRKVAGAQRSQLIMQFLGESLLFTSLSLIFALGLTYLLLPAFSSFIESEGTFNLLNHAKSLIPLFLSVLCVGLLAGAYPAFLMSNFTPSTTLKGSSSATKRSFMRNFLVVVQFSVSIFLIICTMVISNQVNFLKNKKLGFSRNHIVLARAIPFAKFRTMKPVKEELLKYAEVTGVTFSSAYPMQINQSYDFYYQNTNDPENNRLSSYYADVDYDYINLFDMEIIKGRNFDRQRDEGRDVYIINETLAKQLGWDEPVGKQFGLQGREGTIIGVVKDFHNTTMHSKINPVTLHLRPYYPDLLSIKINTDDVQKTLAAIEDVYKRFSNDYPFEYNFMDERYDNLYKSEIRKERAFSYFLGVAIFICCLGLFGLTSFSVERRTKEIGIRKVLGASIPGITSLLYREFTKWVLVSNVFAWPIAYYAMHKWLQAYAYRVNLGIWIFVASALIALLIALLTVSYQSIKAAWANPVTALKYE